MFKWLSNHRVYKSIIFMSGVLLIATGVEVSSIFITVIGIGFGLLALALVIGDT